ncbi:MAG: 2-C-methyl-D-erythritol 2,4-cyclodiphosphate synthase [Solirubrobacterales bacterium]
MNAYPRTGLGWDTHRFAEGRALVVGGVTIEHERGLLGHSDADVLTHAIADAVLGAAALGDIGEHFPDTAEEWKDADSLELLARSCEMARERGLFVVNVDATVIAEEPLMGAHRAQMVFNLAAAIGVGNDAVNVKFTRGEGMGYLGRAEGVAAMAVATLAPTPPDA